MHLCYVTFFFPSHSGHFLLPSISEKCNLIAACVCPSLSVFGVGLGSRFYRIMDSPFGSNLGEIKHVPCRGILKIVIVLGTGRLVMPRNLVYTLKPAAVAVVLKSMKENSDGVLHTYVTLFVCVCMGLSCSAHSHRHTWRQSGRFGVKGFHFVR